jgi:DNA repair protein RAD57
VQDIVDSIARTLGRQPNPLRDVVRNGSEVITTGDASLDEMLGGGIRVGMIWEFVGERQVVARICNPTLLLTQQQLLGFFVFHFHSAAGKTQLALQLSLLVQLPVAQGGLNGSAAYLTTSGGLPTPRLVQLLHEHPLLAGSRSTLDDVQTSTTRTVSSLLHVLSDVLPASILLNNSKDAKARSRPPLKLLVIDSIAELLHYDEEGGKTSTATLSERSRNLSAIAAQLHALAATHQLAVVALNRVTDTWDRRPADAQPGELLYADQARIFGAVEGGSKSAALGLVWANQVNARIMLSRTRQRRLHPVPAAVAPRAEDGHDRKRLRAEGGGAVRVDDVSVRRLSVMFSSVCAPASVDVVITSRGVETLADDDNLGTVTAPVPSPPSKMTATTAPAVADALTVGVARPPLADVSPLDVGSVASDFQPPRPGDIPVGEVEDDEDAYWREVDDFPFASDSIDVVQVSDPS